MVARPRIAVIDYGMGNLFSIINACLTSGMEAKITVSRKDIIAADAVILPGVGAFIDAMEALRRLKLVSVIKDIAESDKPLLGICLGMQLLMRKSYEFEDCKGLEIIKGDVVPFKEYFHEDGRRFKIPHINWNRIWKEEKDSWDKTLLDCLSDGEQMYFAHSYYCVPEDQGIIISTTKYGTTEFCSAFKYRNIIACQFHPERSGGKGLLVYKELFSRISKANGDDQ
jgi:imidazole glycerol-phosphate synthase subunit HisH